MIVMKFGGTSIGSGKNMVRIVRLVEEEPRQKVVVISAMAGVTDKLDKTANKVINLPASVVEEEVNRFYNDLLDQYKIAAEEAISDKHILKETIEKVRELLNELRITLLGVGYLEELTPKSLDYVLSFGERLSVLVLTGALKSNGIPATSLTGYEVGIITNSMFGRARPVHNLMNKTIKARLDPLLSQGIIPVVTGFIAADKNARITTLGRGGSDYTASLLGRYLNVEEVQIWTDVDGIFTTDPKLVPDARLISELSYVEAMDLAYFGAKVIHSNMIEPAMNADIPVRVKNTFNPENEGTLIVREHKKIEGIIKAVTIMREVRIINLSGVGMAETPNIAGRVFNLLGSHNINIIMISGSSEANLSLVISKKDLDKAIESLTELEGDGIRNIEVIEDICIMTVVGAGMRGTRGIAARVFSTISQADANIIMIAQGSFEANIAFVVEENDAERVLKALHDKFIV